jgi:hypothetical protein
MAYSTTISRDDAEDQSERIAPRIAACAIAALSLACWVPVIFVEMAVWSAFS